MNLVIDVGNTRVKYAFFNENVFIEAGYVIADVFEKIGRWKTEGCQIDLFLSGSGQMDDGIKLMLKELSDSWLEADSALPLPIKIDYDTPLTLGFDRVAICAGAVSLFPGRSLLVIDSGTAITYNYVGSEGVFMGGNISPGLEIRFRALHQFTLKLPYVEAGDQYGKLGKTTEDAVRNGVMNGMFFEVKEYIEDFFRQDADARVVITGGNSHFLKNKFESNVYFSEYLGFIGLNVIFEYNKKTINN